MSAEWRSATKRCGSGGVGSAPLFASEIWKRPDPAVDRRHRIGQGRSQVLDLVTVVVNGQPGFEREGLCRQRRHIGDIGICRIGTPPAHPSTQKKRMARLPKMSPKKL